MSTIKTWQERIVGDNRTWAVEAGMKAEIAELRAALAASGGNAAPGLTDEQIDEICNVQEAKYGQLCDTEDMRMFARAIEAASAPNAALVAALEKAQEDINWMLNNRQFLNGHVFDYIDTALSAAGQEVGHG